MPIPIEQTLARALLHQGRRTFCLPASQVAEILGRQLCRSHEWHLCLLDLQDDAIRCGDRLVWKTGAQRVAAYLDQVVTAADLDRLDREAWALWERYARACLEQDVATREVAPGFWRDGQPYIPPWLPQAQRDLATLVLDMAEVADG